MPSKSDVEGYPIGNRGLKRSGRDQVTKLRESEEDASKSDSPKGYKGKHTGKGGSHR